MFVCAGRNENFSFAKSIGVGLIESAIEMTQICMRYAPKQIIFVGSAGSYDDSIGIGEMFYSFCATQLELSFLENKSYTPLDNSVEMQSFTNVSHETLVKQEIESLKIPKVVVNSSNYITCTSRFNAVMLHAGITLENMEFFSILKVSQHFNIPSFGVFCVSNYVGENAHNEFIANHNQVKERLIQFYTKNFVDRI